MIKAILIILIYLSNLNLIYAVDKNENCKDEVHHFLTQYETKLNWYRKTLVNRIYEIAPGKEIGTWYRRYLNNGNVYIQRRSPLTQIDIEFDPKCKPTIFNKVFVKSNGFSDKNLATLLSENNQGIIYIWSPKMPLSIRGLESIKIVAKNLQIHLTVLLDPNTPNIRILEMIKTNFAQKIDTVINDSYELSVRGASNHFPMLFVYKNKKLIRNGFPAYENTVRYQKIISLFLSKGIKGYR